MQVRHPAKMAAAESSTLPIELEIASLAVAAVVAADASLVSIGRRMAVAVSVMTWDTSGRPEVIVDTSMVCVGPNEAMGGTTLAVAMLLFHGGQLVLVLLTNSPMFSAINTTSLGRLNFRQKIMQKPPSAPDITYLLGRQYPLNLRQGTPQ